MCNPASLVATKDRVFWSKTTDSHREIITEHNLCERGVRGVNVVPLEIVPLGGNLSLPIKDWKFSIDYQGYDHELPEWWDDKKYEAMARAELKEWADVKLKGWKVKEAFNPVNPLKQKQDKSLDKVALLKDWDSVRASVRASVRYSVWDSVRDSVRASVGAYMSSLFPSITKWKYIDHKQGKNPYQSGIDLWHAGLVPSYNGETWRLHNRDKILWEAAE